MYQRRVRVTTVGACVAVLLTACAGTDDSSAVDEAALDFSATCTNEIHDAEGPSVVSASVRSDGDQIDIHATVTGDPGAFAGSEAFFTVTFVNETDGMRVIELAPGAAAGERVSVYDLDMSGREYLDEDFDVLDDEIAYTVSASVLEDFGPLSGWSFTAADDEHTAFCGDPYNPNPFE